MIEVKWPESPGKPGDSLWFDENRKPVWVCEVDSLKLQVEALQEEIDYYIKKGSEDAKK